LLDFWIGLLTRVSLARSVGYDRPKVDDDLRRYHVFRDGTSFRLVGRGGLCWTLLVLVVLRTRVVDFDPIRDRLRFQEIA